MRVAIILHGGVGSEGCYNPAWVRDAIILHGGVGSEGCYNSAWGCW